MTNVIRNVLKVVLPLLVVAIGVVLFRGLVASKPPAQRAERPDRAPLVQVQRATSGTHTVVVQGQGEVVPAQRVVLQPELTGRVVWQNENLVPGGRFRKGERILRIDPRNYQVAIEQQSAQRDRAQMELELERGRQAVAQREWQLFGGEANAQGGDATAEGRALALREPQLRTARVAVTAADSALDRAQLDLRRTNLVAPFNAVVQAEAVDPGQLVGPQTQVATLVGTDQFWVQVSVPLDVLSHVQVPGVGAAEGEGSTARVVQDIGDRRIERTGRIVRLLGDLDPIGRMARVLVAIDDPLGLEERPESGAEALPLLLGAYVHVYVEGDRVDDVIEIPRVAMREGDRVYVVNDESRLEFRDVEIAWRTEDTVLVRSGLRHGERFVTSRVPTPVEGMELRTEEDGPEAAAPRAQAKRP